MTTCSLDCSGDVNNPYTPNFTPSSTPCTLTSVSETRARLINGVLFRSIGFGLIANNITVACTWYDAADTVTTDGSVMTYYKIFITDGSTSETFGPYNQSQTTNPTPPPSYTWTSDINTMVSDITTNSTLVDVFLNGDSHPGYSIPTAATYMDTFTTTNLSGGTGGGTSAAGLRTGPYESLLYISSSEDDTGAIINTSQTGQRVGKMLHWVGTDENTGAFVLYDPNPNSPTYTSPKICVSSCA